MMNAPAVLYTFLLRHSPRSILLQCLFMLSVVNVVLLNLVFVGCEREHQRKSEIVEEKEVKDSLMLSFYCDMQENEGESSLDVFCYEADELRRLISHERIVIEKSCQKGKLPIECKYELREAGMIVAAVLNCPFRFKDDALQLFTALESIRFKSSYDNPLKPIMSAISEIHPTKEKGHIKLHLHLTRLWSRIVITEIHNDSGVRLEDPVLYLSACNSEAELFRTQGFRASIQSEDSIRVPLPHDIGKYSQYPNIQLWAYPNDSEAELPGCERTILNMEFLMHLDKEEGTHIHSTSCKLPALRRNSSISCTINIDKEGEMQCGFYNDASP